METLASLSRLAEKLNQTTDSYTRSLIDVEKQLRDMNIGVETWLTISETAKSGSPDRETSSRKMLGYAKLSDGWSLAVKTLRIERGQMPNDRETHWENIYEDESPRPLLKSSREWRIEAAAHVPALLNAIETHATELVLSLEKAEAELQSFGNARLAHRSPKLHWVCDSCGDELQSPRERCRCPIIKTSEGGEVNPPRRNIETKIKK